MSFNKLSLSFLVLVLGVFVSCSNSTTRSSISSITVIPSDPLITKSGTQQFVAIATYLDNTIQDITSDVTWTSGVETVATISTTGLATGISTGLSVSTITATLGSMSGTTNLMVDPIYVSECKPISIGAFSSVKNFLTLNFSNLISMTGTASYLSSDCSGGVDVYVLFVVNTENAVPETTGVGFDEDLFAILKTPIKVEAFVATDQGLVAVTAITGSSFVKDVWTDITTEPFVSLDATYNWFKIFNSESTVSSIYGGMDGSNNGSDTLIDLISAGDPVIIGEQVDYALNILTATEWLPAR